MDSQRRLHNIERTYDTINCLALAVEDLNITKDYIKDLMIKSTQLVQKLILYKKLKVVGNYKIMRSTELNVQLQKN